MADVRYMGTGSWSRVVTDDKGKFDHLETVRPGDVVSLDDDAAKVLAGPQTPRNLRVFVYAGSEEDKHGENYKASRYESVEGNATPYPELDMGSTVVSGRTITRTEEDNPEGFALAGPDEGPASNNRDAVAREDAAREGEKAYRHALDSQKRQAKGGAETSSVSTSASTERPAARRSGDEKK